MRYMVPLRWQVEGFMNVEATNKAEALKQVLEDPRIISKNYQGDIVVDVKNIRRLT